MLKTYLTITSVTIKKFNTLIRGNFNNTQIQESKSHRTFIEIFKADIKKGQ